jgi:Do/DeqQ family serine protease
MAIKRMFRSRNFFLINFASASMIVGFLIGIFSWSCSTRLPPGEIVYAQDRELAEEDIEGLSGLQASFRKLAAKASPVTVAVDVVDILQRRSEDFFNPFGGEDDLRRPGAGSGIIVRRTGNRIFILTNNHVVGEVEEIRVRLHDGREYDARLVGGDERKDLALVMIETNEADIAVARLGDSEKVEVGDWVLAVGNPFFLENTVTSGIVSALGRRGRGPGLNISDFIQTDAAINPGNSGGALMNIKGEVIGINTWIASDTGMGMGFGFAIPINNAKKAIDDFIKLGKIEYAWLGVQIGEVPEDVAEDMGIEGRKGAFVNHVFKSSPAGTGGILPGDFIYQLNGKRINDFLELTNALGDLIPGEEAEFELIRQGEELNLLITLTVRQDRQVIDAQNEDLWPGIAIVPLTRQRREALDARVGKGVVIANVERETQAAVAGFRENDVIISINGEDVGGAGDFYRLLSEASRRRFEMRLERNRDTITLDLVR